MGAISDKLSYLIESKNLIKTAIMAKGVTIQDDTPFRNYADLISTISGDGIQYVISEPVDIALDASSWNGHSYHLYLSGYNYNIESGIQVGLPTSSSAVNTQAVIKAAISIQYYSQYAPSESSAGSVSIDFSVVNVPTEDITIAIYGLVPTVAATITTEVEATE